MIFPAIDPQKGQDAFMLLSFLPKNSLKMESSSSLCFFKTNKSREKKSTDLRFLDQN